MSRDRNHKPDSPLSAPKLASSVQNASFRSIGFVFSKPPFCDRIWVRPCKNASTLDWVRFFGLLSRTEVASNVQKSLRDVRGTQVVTHPLCPISENWVRACKIAARPRLGSFFRVRHSATGLASSVQNAAATLRSAQAATRATVVRGSENWLRPCKNTALPRLGSFVRVPHLATQLGSNVQKLRRNLPAPRCYHVISPYKPCPCASTTR